MARVRAIRTAATGTQPVIAMGYTFSVQSDIDTRTSTEIAPAKRAEKRFYGLDFADAINFGRFLASLGVGLPFLQIRLAWYNEAFSGKILLLRSEVMKLSKETE